MTVFNYKNSEFTKIGIRPLLLTILLTLTNLYENTHSFAFFPYTDEMIKNLKNK